MSVWKDKRTGIYQYDFQIDGHRFHGSSKATNEKDALAFERAENARAKEQLKTSKAAKTSLRLDDVAGRYWLEVGQHHAEGDSKQNTWRQINRLIEFFGKDTIITEITGDDVARLVAWRRSHRVIRSQKRKPEECPLVSVFTVNDTTEQLKKLFTRAKKWGIRFQQEPVWKDYWLKEPEERVRELVGNEAERLDDETRNDYKPLFEFEKASGVRLKECVTLRWKEVNWREGQIMKKGKGDRWIVVPITPHVRSILWPLRGQHPELVFTYLCARTMRRPERIKGRRYPVTYNGLKSLWKRLRKRADMTDFRFHDFRHDVGTKLLRKTGNLKLVQKALNHRNIETTMRYAHVSVKDVAEAMQDLQESRKKSRKTSASKSKRLKVLAV